MSYQQGPHTRIYVTKRSWLDAGTEVLPGDRKFTDYAFPPEIGYPSFARENNNRPIDRQPLNPPSDLGGYPHGLPAVLSGVDTNRQGASPCMPRRSLNEH